MKKRVQGNAVTTEPTTYRCQLCGAERKANELYHDGKSFITCLDMEDCLTRVGYQELARTTAIRFQPTDPKKWAEMKRRARG